MNSWELNWDRGNELLVTELEPKKLTAWNRTGTKEMNCWELNWDRGNELLGTEVEPKK
jgi:hypothetical protein